VICFDPAFCAIFVPFSRWAMYAFARALIFAAKSGREKISVGMCVEPVRSLAQN
jgi:hypothetical protein